MGDEDDAPAGGGDMRMFWMEERISYALRLKPEKLKALQGNAESRCVADSPSCRSGLGSGCAFCAWARIAARTRQPVMIRLSGPRLSGSELTLRRNGKDPLGCAKLCWGGAGPGGGEAGA